MYIINVQRKLKYEKMKYPKWLFTMSKQFYIKLFSYNYNVFYLI